MMSTILKNFLLMLLFKELIDSFFLAFDNTNNGDNKVERISCRKYFLPIVNIIKHNVLIDGRNFYDEPIDDPIKV